MCYYNNALPGRGRIPFTDQFIEISADDAKNWRFKRFISWKKDKYVIFQNGNQEIMQKDRTLQFVRCKPGEENINAKLSNAEGVEIYNRANAGENIVALAKEFKISTDHALDIRDLRARVGITLNYLHGQEKPKPAKVLVAKRAKNRKLSMSLAKFIRADREKMKMPTTALAKKYCVNKSTILRILRNEMYAEKS